MLEILKVHTLDNVAVAISALEAGQKVQGLVVKENIESGHKVAVRDIKKGEAVIKYGCPIGRASADIAAGERVHTHNLTTALEGRLEYSFSGGRRYEPAFDGESCFDGYESADGRAGIRNEIWILPLVGCVNSLARSLAQRANTVFKGVEFYAFEHPYGCSQLGGDLHNAQKILAGLASHPNAAGVLLLSLGCENNNFSVFKPFLGSCDSGRIKLLVAGECEDEFACGLELLDCLYRRAAQRKRVKISVDKLTVGFKCGGSDGFSGLTANALCGRLCDRLTSLGSTAILSETPEMFGAEQLLMQRAADKNVFDKTVEMINGFKQYYLDNGQRVSENPSPGNMRGGISTLEEKSLGCIQKGGSSVVTDVLGYGDRASLPGLSLLASPGNDIVSCSAMAAAGAQLIVFTTGRGTPLGSPVPVLKIASNSDLARRKSGWIDFDAGGLLDSQDFERSRDELFALLLKTACGGRTRSEQNGCRDFAIFKNGVTL